MDVDKAFESSDFDISSVSSLSYYDSDHSDQDSENDVDISIEPDDQMPGFQLQPVRGVEQGSPVEDFIPDLWWLFNRMARIDDVSWCVCTLCTAQSNPFNSHCCHENIKMLSKIKSETTDPITCITQHPGFQVNCLNIYVLEKDYHRYKKEYGAEQNINRRHRYVAYRNLVVWIHGLLGQRNRIALPACALTAIRHRFPEESGVYVGHLEVQHATQELLQ